MQFAKADSDWLPNSGFVLFVVLGWFTAAAGLGTLLLLALAFIPRVSLGVDAPWLLALMGNLTGYLAALALGVLGAGAQLILSRRPFTAKEQVAFRQGALQLTTVAIGSVSLGLLALMTWQQRHLGRFWTHSPVEWGSLLILTCLGTMLWLQLKQEAHDRIRYAVATLSGVSVFITWLGYGPATYPRTAWITPIAASLTLVIAISQLGLIFRRPAPRNSSRLA
jgi:hypothetical protein